MTRREELEERAKRIVDSIYGNRAESCMGSCYDDYVAEIVEALQSVEREVWLKIINKVSDLELGDGDHLIGWCYAQKTEVVP